MKHIILSSILSVLLIGSGAHANKVKENDSFPAFKLSGLRDKRDKPVDLKSLKKRNKVIILDFWASWCGPCREAMPILDKIYSKYKKKGVTVIGINVDNDKGSGRKFTDEVKVQFPLVFDDGQKVSGKVGVPAMPSSYILDSSGKVRFIHKGFYPGDDKKFEAEIVELLKSKSKRKPARSRAKK